MFHINVAQSILFEVVVVVVAVVTISFQHNFEIRNEMNEMK